MIKRYINWIDYYIDLKDKMKVDAIHIIDDGSDSQYIEDLKNHYEDFESIATITSLHPHLGRPKHLLHYGWMRSFLYNYHIATTYDYTCIIHCESDFYIFNTDKLSHIESGWHMPYCDQYRFPEAGIQVICNDQFPHLKEMYEKGYEILDGHMQVEDLFRFASRLDMRGIRWESSSPFPQDMDYVGQITLSPQ